MHSVFAAASRFADSSDRNLSIVWIEDIDRLCSKRTEHDPENTQTVSQLLTCIDGLRASPRVLVLATTTRPFALDEALRRAGRFDKEIPVLPPSQSQRKQILALYFEAFHAAQQVQSLLDELSLLTRGFSGADLEMFVRQAVVASVERRAPLALPLLLSVLGGIVPTVMKDEEKVAGIDWNMIGGMDAIKTQLQRVQVPRFPYLQYIEWPFRYKSQFRRFHLAPPRGILLYGPPGCAKTTLARAIASEAHASFWTLNTSQVFTPYVGESEVGGPQGR